MITAGTASILVSLAVVPVALCCYASLGMAPRWADLWAIAIPMGSGSIVGAMIGGLAIGLVAPGILKVILGFVLIVSSIDVFARTRAKA